MGMMIWRMEVGADMVAGAAMAGRVMEVGVRRLWEVCTLGVKVAMVITGSIIAIVRGADRGELTGVGVKGKRRSMIEGIDDAGWV